MPQAWEDQWSAKEVGDAIRELRAHRVWTKAHLAREAGLDEDQIAAYEEGLVRASRSTLARIATAVDVPVEQVERYLLPLMKPLRAALEGPAPGGELLAELEGLLHRGSLAFSQMLRAYAMKLLVQAGVLEGASGSLPDSRAPDCGMSWWQSPGSSGGRRSKHAGSSATGRFLHAAARRASRQHRTTRTKRWSGRNWPL